MQITKAVPSVLVAVLLLTGVSASAEFLGQDALFTGVRRPTKGQEGLPKIYRSHDPAFTVSLDDGSIPDEREPASTSRPATAKPKAHWSASISEGFEFKIRVKQQVSAVWVLKRDDHYDLIFANNAGSRVNLSLRPNSFMH